MFWHAHKRAGWNFGSPPGAFGAALTLSAGGREKSIVPADQQGAFFGNVPLGAGTVCAFVALCVREREREMAPLQDDLREAAASCLDIAQTTTDLNARTRLLTLAQKFMELAGASSSDQVFEKLLDEFNDAQMLKPSS
jgi:hypothetical protein